MLLTRGYGQALMDILYKPGSHLPTYQDHGRDDVCSFSHYLGLALLSLPRLSGYPTAAHSV